MVVIFFSLPFVLIRLIGFSIRLNHFVTILLDFIESGSTEIHNKRCECNAGDENFVLVLREHMEAPRIGYQAEPRRRGSHAKNDSLSVEGFYIHFRLGTASPTPRQ
jgi:hypothetical protein